MAIAINGSGTLTGVSVGGLPNGIVDTDMLAAKAVTAAKRGSGGILQVVHLEYGTQVATTSSDFVDTGLTQAITPIQTGSKILVHVFQHAYVYKAGDGQGFRMRLRQDTTTRYGPAHSYEFYYNYNSGNAHDFRDRFAFSSFHLHGITAGTSTTYKVQGGLHSTAASANLAFQQGGARSMMTIMEVAV